MEDLRGTGDGFPITRLGDVGKGGEDRYALSALEHIVADAAPYLQTYGYPVLFVVLFLESLGIPAPGESLLIAAAVLAGRQEMSLSLIIPIAWAAAVLGDNVGYAIGRFGGRRLILKYGLTVGATRDRLETVERFFREHGGWIVVVARFIVPLRQLNGIVAGSATMPWWRFLLFNALGAALWVGSWSLAGRYVGDHVALVLRWIQRHAYDATGLAAIGLLVVGVLFFILRRRRRKANTRGDSNTPGD